MRKWEGILLSVLILLGNFFILPAQNIPADSSHIISKITITGNRTTKDFIILRELSFSINDTIGDSLLKAGIEKSKQNLLNTSLFNFVNITSIHKENITEISIEVAERWYWFPLPIFETVDRNFNIWLQKMDLGRINYGAYIVKENFRGRKEKLRLIFKTGYTRQYGLAYDVPYLDRKQKQGLSFAFSYLANHEITYGSSQNKQLFLKIPHEYARTELFSRFRYSYRQGIYNYASLEVRYTLAKMNDTILNFTRDYFPQSSTQANFLALDLFLKRDKRDSRQYPLNGYYLALDITKNGLSLLKDEQVDFMKFEGDFSWYKKLFPKFYLATGISGKSTIGPNQPYYLQRGLGYSDYVRGYEYYVVDAQHYLLAKNGVKLELLKPRVKKLNFIPLKKFSTVHFAFYLDLFADAGYAWDKKYRFQNSLAGETVFGYGSGLNLVTYYDIVFRVEFTRNRLKENGIFIHFSAPI